MSKLNNKLETKRV